MSPMLQAEREEGMRYRAVVFDLFGTLIKGFTRRDYDQVNARMAEAVGVPFPEFWQLVGETYRGKCLGHYSSFEDNIQDICSRFGLEMDAGQITQAARYHYEFMADALVPEQEVLEALGMLKVRGLKCGLISDCGPEVPLLWGESPLARLIDVPVFSCEERIGKPNIDIYQVAAHRLQVQPPECIYVGDGGSDELKGAAVAGMLSILKRTNLNDVYDRDRPEIADWNGPVIDRIVELPDLLRKMTR